MKSYFKIGSVIEWTIVHSSERELFRVVWKNERADKVWLIQVPPADRRNDYCRAPFIVSFRELVHMLDSKQILVAEVDPPVFWLLSDEYIRGKYLRKDGQCATLNARDERWSWLADLFSSNSSEDIFEAGLIPAWVSCKAKKVGKSRAKVYHALHTYLAGGFYKNSLLMDWHRCGAKGKQRVQYRKLGRPSMAVLADPSRSKGYVLKEIDKQRIQHAWKYFFRDGKTVYAAFLEMAGVFYRSGIKCVDGRDVPILLPAEERPTLDQFRYWGPLGNPHEAAWIKKLGQLEWAKKFKGLSGSAKDGIVAVGQIAFCDTTSNDVHLISITSRLKPVGTLNRLEIYEGRSELIIGFHCGFDAPSSRTFLLAVAHAASSKVEYCARFGIHITDEDFPALAVRVYLGDNGEYRSEKSLAALSALSGATVEWAAAGHPELKGPIEGRHHQMHSRLDHTLNGTTYGQQRRRGRKNPVLDSCLNYHEYMHEYIKEILYYNNEEIVDHLLTVEMRKDDVKPTRIEIYRWLVRKGYVVDFKPNAAIVRAHLLPALPAQLTETGVFLLREDRGDKIERVWGLRYMSNYLIESGMLAEARRVGPKRVTVRGNPEAPDKMWLETESGLKELRNTSEDHLLKAEATVRDCLVIQDDDKVREICERSNVDQKRSDIISSREIVQEEARAAKQREMDALPVRPSKSVLISGIEANRRAEQILLAEMDARNKRLNGDLLAQASHSHETAPSQPIQPEDPAKQALKAFLNKKR